MHYSKWLLALAATLLALGAASLFGGATTARGQSGGGPVPCVIPTTHTITADAWLVCDVDCQQAVPAGGGPIGPCINFGRPNIKLSLNGFKMTGRANEPPRQGCVSDSEFPTNEADGIHSKFDEVQIVGPGLVQRMRRHGIALIGTAADPLEKAQVKKVTSHQNCFSGIFMGAVTNTLVDEVVSVRNSANSGFRPCGGICVTNSHKNVIRRGEFAGTGSIAPGPNLGHPFPNDFGIGLVGSSSGNIVEENGIGGNINGLALFPLPGLPPPSGNLIKKNVIAGNPPIEISADNPGINPVGADIRDFSVPGTNKFEDNLCITYTGGETPPPCAGNADVPDRPLVPKLPHYAGHQNN
jgi:Right handed beta helix region